METLCRTLTTGRPAPTTIGLIMIKRSRLIMIMVMMASIDVIFCVSGLHSEKPPEEPRWPLLERRCQPLRRHYWGESEVTPSWERMQLPSKKHRRWNQMWVQWPLLHLMSPTNSNVFLWGSMIKQVCMSVICWWILCGQSGGSRAWAAGQSPLPSP